MESCILSIDEIKKKCVSVFEKIDFVEKVYLFGSYARGEATENSDLDLMIVLNRDIGFDFFLFYDLLQDTFHKNVDVLQEEEVYRIMPKTFERDKVLIYER